MKEYKIGEVSRIVNLPVETIRFLEQIGLIAPRRKPGGAYRLYTAADIDKIDNYRWFRNIGFMAQDSISMIHDVSLEQYMERMHTAQQNAECQQLYYKLLAQRLRDYNQKMRGLYSSCATCVTAASPERYWRSNLRYNGVDPQFTFAECLEGCFEEQAQYWAFADNIFCIRKDDFYREDAENRILWGFGMERKWIELLQIQTWEKMEYIPSVSSIYTVIRWTKNGSVQEKIRSNVFPYLEEHGYRVNGDVWGVLVATVAEEGEEVSYMEVWVPI